MNTERPEPSQLNSAGNERRLVFLLCVLAAIHVLVFSAAFPFFGPVDEVLHFDVTLKYAQGKVPRDLGPYCDEAVPYIIWFGTFEYLPPDYLPGDKYPVPPWLLPLEVASPRLILVERRARTVKNWESSQPPLYYLMTGLWWRVAKAMNLEDGLRLYGIRFLNVFLVTGMIWLGYLAAKILFPERRFLRLGVPALLAFIPQSVFYSIENDSLSPLCFGLVFVCLLRWLEGRALSYPRAVTLGVAIAATFLTKLSNLPLLVVVGVVIGLKAWREIKAGTGRQLARTLPVVVLCAGLPVVGWMLWLKQNYGDFMGETSHVMSQHWTRLPINEWSHHPIFTPTGGWVYLSTLLSSFWRGEMLWNGHPLISASVKFIYALLSILMLGMALKGFWPTEGGLSKFQRQSLWLCLAIFLAGVFFLAFLSLQYDYHDCVNPSREHPYFYFGRLILGAVIPFALLFVYGLDTLMIKLRSGWARPGVLTGIVLFMLITEITDYWPIFKSAYNLYKM